MQAAWEAFLKPMSDAKGLSTLLPLEQRHVKDAWYFLARAPLPADVVAKLKAQGERGETLAKFDVHSYVVRKVSAGATTDRWFKDIALFGAPIASFGEAANRNAAVFQLRSLSGDDSTLVMVEGQGGAMGALYYEEPVDVASGWLDGGTAVVGVRTASSNAIYAFASGAFRNVHESKSLPVLRASCTDPTKAFSATDDCDWGVTGDVRGKDPSTFEFIEYSVPAGVSGLCATVAKRCRFEATSYTYDGTKQRFVRKAGESPKTVDHELRIVHRRSAAKK